MRRPILMDVSYLIAVHYRKDKNHETAALFEQSSTRLRLIPDVVLPEASHMLHNYLGQPAVFNMIQAVLNSPAQLTAITKPDLQRAYEVM